MNPTPADREQRGASLGEADLTALVSLSALQTLQDRFAALGKVTVCMATVAGELMTVPSWGSRFSELIGTSPSGKVEFAQTISTCTLELGTKVPLACHEGMMVCATPIIHKDCRLAVIVVGTRTPNPPARRQVDQIAHSYRIDAGELWRHVSYIDPYNGGDPEAILEFADALADTIAMLYGQASRIQSQLSDLRTVHGLAELLSGTRNLQEILDSTVQRVVEVMPVKACGIRLLDVDTGELVVKAVCNLSDEYLQKGPVMLHESEIDSTAFSGQTVYVPDMAIDPRTRYPSNARREGIVSGLCVPLTYRGQTVGVMRVYTGKLYAFSESQKTLLHSIGSQAAAAIITNRLWEEQGRAERVRRQVRAAGEIQHRMLPAQPPQHDKLQFGCVYDPTLEVGGDFYDFIELSDKSLGLCVADVVGKGLPAALLMASARSALRAHAPTQGSQEVDTVVGKVNRHMYRDTLISEFATLFYCVFNEDADTVVYCNAGHIPPLLLRGGDFEELSTGGLVIGVDPDEVYQQGRATLRSGDVLVMVTDGVTEAMDFQGSAYGNDQLRRSILKHRSLDAQLFAQQILWDVRRFAGLADQSDDITIVVAKVV